jgi:hypothetical protein
MVLCDFGIAKYFARPLATADRLQLSGSKPTAWTCCPQAHMLHSLLQLHDRTYDRPFNSPCICVLLLQMSLQGRLAHPQVGSWARSRPRPHPPAAQGHLRPQPPLTATSTAAAMTAAVGALGLSALASLPLPPGQSHLGLQGGGRGRALGAVPHV